MILQIKLRYSSFFGKKIVYILLKFAYRPSGLLIWSERMRHNQNMINDKIYIIVCVNGISQKLHNKYNVHILAKLIKSCIIWLDNR